MISFERRYSMSKVAVVYWSGTGNTEAMANLVADGVKEAGGEPEVIEAVSFGPGDLGDYDAYAFGCPAMGDEELEEDEFEPMYDSVEPDVAASKKKTALFGSFEWNDGDWMTYWKDRAVEHGVNIVDTAIARDYPEDEAVDDCKKLGAALV